MVIHPNRNQELEGDFDKDPIKFSLDMLLEPEALVEDDPFFLFTDMIEMMQICNLAELPDQFNGPEYISPLSGNTMRH